MIGVKRSVDIFPVRPNALEPKMKAPASKRWLIGMALAIGAYIVAPLPVHAQTGGLGGAGAGGGAGGGGGGTGFSQGVGGGSTVSASFAGGQATSFSGGTAFAGGGAGGAAGGGAGGGAGRLGGAGAVLAPTTMNPFRTTYVPTLSLGLYTIANTAPSAAPGAKAGGTTSAGTYGQPLYPLSTTGGAGAAGVRGGGLMGGAGALGGTAGGTSSSAGFTTFGVPRAPVYITTLDESIPRIQHSTPVLNEKLQTMLASSTNLSRFGPVDLSVESGTVTLRGNVKTVRDRKLVEGMIRLTPGVRDVRNELTIGPR